MCGLVAIFNYMASAPAVNKVELRAIRESMYSRGPDGSGEWFSKNLDVGLGHRRLSIFDLTTAGAQPMSYSNGSLHIVFNGAIYNYLALRKELHQKGYIFNSHTDTEVLLAGWQEWQEDIVYRLRGMFSFVIYDAQKQSIFVVRDPFGIKPLYYADDGETIKIASQVKALVAGNPSRYSADETAEVGFYLWGSVQEPRTLFSEIKAFEPGTSLLLSKNGPRSLKKFMSVSSLVQTAYEKSLSWSDEEVVDRYRNALSSSLRMQLMADVPVGVFLSSGLDSNCLAALAQENREVDFMALTLGFREHVGSSSDETVLASKSANNIGCRHSISWIGKEDFLNNRERFFDSMDQPSIDGLNTWFVCKAAKDAGLKVAISGLGADEFLSGYPSFRQVPMLVKNLNRLSFLKGKPGYMIDFLMGILFKNSRYHKLSGLMQYGFNLRGSYFLRRAVNTPNSLSRYVDPDVVKDSLEYFADQIMSQPKFSESLSENAQISILESSLYMRNQLLRDSDWASMAHSIELRVPFVAQDVIIMSARASKSTLLHCPKYNLINEIASRPKTGFSIPVRSWMSNSSSSRDISIPDWSNVVFKEFQRRASF